MDLGVGGAALPAPLLRRTGILRNQTGISERTRSPEVRMQ